MVPGPQVGPRGTISLRDYQAEALDAIRVAWQRGVKRQLVCLPTGPGKTMLFSHLARQRMGRVLILAHRDELIQQAASKLREVDPLLSVGIALQRRRRRGTPRILVGSVQALSRPKRLAKGTPSFGTIIVDEAHHSPAPAISGSLLLWGPSSKTGLWSSE
jgi:superfamily II DNA or RNA helicase